jgi:hypothetical protein
MSELKELQKRLENERDINNALICNIEEMAELIKVLCKYLRNSSKFSMGDLTEELAHNLLMTNVVKNRFNISDEEIENEQLSALRKCFK